jgi:hypothetical protein
MPVSSAQKQDRSRKLGRVAELRRNRMPFHEIAKVINREFGGSCSKQYAWELYQQVLTEYPSSQVDELRTEQQILIDDAIQNLLTIAMSEQESGRTRVEAWNSIRGWLEQQAKVFGLNAPIKSEVLTLSQVDMEIMKLERELEEASAE